MPQPHLRTRSKKRLKAKLSGGRTRVHYRVANISPSKCTLCNQPLAGIPHLTQARIGKLTRSQKRIWRPFGGQICHNCLKNALKQTARKF